MEAIIKILAIVIGLGIRFILFAFGLAVTLWAVHIAVPTFWTLFLMGIIFECVVGLVQLVINALGEIASHIGG